MNILVSHTFCQIAWIKANLGIFSLKDKKSSGRLGQSPESRQLINVGGGGGGVKRPDFRFPEVCISALINVSARSKLPMNTD